MLKKLTGFPGISGPVVTIVMDGYGLPKTPVGSAIAAAVKPNLDRLFAECPNIRLRAHGKAVGMPSDEDMGNSEVGHNAIGAGQVYAQGAALVHQVPGRAGWELRLVVQGGLRILDKIERTDTTRLRPRLYAFDFVLMLWRSLWMQKP